MTWFFELLKQMSPVIVKALQDGLKNLLDELAQKAKETDNKWDDWAVAMMAKVFGIELKDE